MVIQKASHHYEWEALNSCETRGLPSSWGTGTTGEAAEAAEALLGCNLGLAVDRSLSVLVVELEHHELGILLRWITGSVLLIIFLR